VRIRSLIACLSLLCTLPAAAQLTAQFYLEKTTFAPGEPIFLYLKLLNKGPDYPTVVTPSHIQPGCAGANIVVSSDLSTYPNCRFYGIYGCAGSGTLPTMTLAPGQTYTGRFSLNVGHEINAPGDYWVDAKYTAMPSTLTSGDAHTKLNFRVDGKLPPYPLSKYQLFLNDLKTGGSDARREAALILASLAPRSLESTLLGFANDPDLRGYAPLAFHRLNTPRSMAAMADLIKTDKPGAPERMEAIRYLAESGDQQWYPLLLDIAEKEKGGTLVYAAELGGEKFLPALVALERSPDAHLIAVEAMGYAGSRAAVPLLLDQLDDPDTNISDRANYSLWLLTHRSAAPISQNFEGAAEALKWSQWWAREGATAPIYKYCDCGATTPLP
jgi:hypothetical protein